MATKAIFYLRMEELPAKRLFQSMRCQRPVPDRDVESLNIGVITYKAFIPLALSFKDPGLRARPEIPADWRRDRALSVRDAVGAAVALRLHGIGVIAFMKRKFRMRSERRIRLGEQESPAHRRLRLRLRFGAMATGTRAGGACLVLHLCRHAQSREQNRERQETKAAQEHSHPG